MMDVFGRRHREILEEERQITREVIRRNELAFQEGTRALQEATRVLSGLVEVTVELRDDIRAQRQGFLALLARLGNGGEAAT